MWDYVDENCVLRVGTEKEMEQAGVPLPNPKACDIMYINHRIYVHERIPEEMAGYPDKEWF